MRIGYVRVSTDEKTERQETALNPLDVEKMFIDFSITHFTVQRISVPMAEA